MNKTSFRFGLFMSRVALIGAVVCALTIGAFSVDVGVVTGTVVNVRKGPGLGYERVELLAKGRQVAVHAEENGWYKVAWGEATGYINKDYVSLADVVASAGVPCNAAVTGGNINVRTGPGTAYSRTALLGTGKRVALLGEKAGWYQIAFDGKSGYIFGEYLIPDTVAAVGTAADGEVPIAVAEASALAASNADRVGIITGGTINVRAGAGLEFQRITQLRAGKKVMILAEENGWYKIRFDGRDGYVLGDYVWEGSSLPASSIGDQAAAMAAQYIGVPYVYGGSIPSGFDCSGLTMYLYRQLGYTLPHSASGQYTSCGLKISRSELQPGDLLFFTSSGAGGRINHVGIYVGSGQFVHARRSVGRVQTNNLCESYYTKNYVGAVRVS